MTSSPAPDGTTGSTEEVEEVEEPDNAEGVARRRLPAPVSALLRSLASTAVLVALGYAAYRWAATGLPMEPLPGSPWAYLATGAAFCLAGCLLLRWAVAAAKARADADGDSDYFSGLDYVVSTVVFAGIRICLAYRPDLATVWTYGFIGIGALGVVAVVWRRRLARHL
ncbi:hypothetical protein [Streptomyces sp. NPDC090022]|uniref:hypothetical protein n=1 Tax=Streptomyces sp. NPDC090022 TaxID=3365920 RepID=UPI0037F9B442